jgi:hypothetical protein
MTALAILLANSNNRGGGDLHSEEGIVGSWAGDRIVIAGDYAVKHDKCESMNKKENIYSRCYTEEFYDISNLVINAMADDEYLHKALIDRVGQLSLLK